MTIRLFCSDGSVRLRRDYFEKSLFRNLEIVTSRSYTLHCRARSETVNDLLEWIDGDSKEVTITKDNVHELRSLCEELGFSGLDKQLNAFRSDPPGSDYVDIKERVTRQDKLLAEIQRQFKEILNWKNKNDSLLRQLESLERRFDELARTTDVSAVRNRESSRKMEHALQECVKRSDFEKLMAHLKERETESMTNSRTIRVTPSTKQKGEFVCDASNLLEGIIAHLTRECGGNVHDKGIVNITASSVCQSACRSFSPRNVVDPNRDLLYCSQNQKDAWITYDFKEWRVIPKRYSIKTSYGWSPGGDHLKSWVIEVSNDGDKWMEIDRRDNNSDLTGQYVTANFKISHVPSESFRFFRLRQTGPNDANSYVLAIGSLEIFGTLCEK